MVAMETLKFLWEFLNSNAFSSLASAGLGALGGAIAAQKISERAKKKEELLEEIRNVNAAIVITFDICNTFLSLKSQHIKSLKEDFYNHQEEFFDHGRRLKSGEVSRDKIFHLIVDMKTITIPEMPIDILQNYIFEKTSAKSRALSLVSVISRTINGLKISLDGRNAAIHEFKANGIDPATYFGLPKDNKINEIYKNSVDAIYSQTDDGIFFTKLLCSDLKRYGDSINGELREKFKIVDKRINHPDFSDAERLGLMPKNEDYNDWLTMFIDMSKEATEERGSGSLWGRVQGWFCELIQMSKKMF